LHIEASMKGLVIVLGLASLAGCATAQPLVVSDEQYRRFTGAIREAEQSGIADGPAEAVRLLDEAKSGFEYAQRLPLYPDRARELLEKAQRDADAAVALVREAAKARLAAAAAARHAALLEAAAPVEEAPREAPQMTAATGP
jgi:non-ribosomal peptide synthetase component F